MGVRDELAITALARALVRTGMYLDAGIDTSAGLENPRVYAAAILNDPDMARDGLHFVMVETLERLAATPTASPTEDRKELWGKFTGGEKLAYGIGWRDAERDSAEIANREATASPTAGGLDVERLEDVLREYAALTTPESPEREAPTD